MPNNPKATSSSKTNPPTNSPTTKNPSIKSPTTKSPTTKSPTTKSPTTSSPTTKSPTASSPTTDSPSTTVPSTNGASTTVHSTNVQATNVQATNVASTNIQSTNVAPTKKAVESTGTAAPNLSTPNPLASDSTKELELKEASVTKSSDDQTVAKGATTNADHTAGTAAVATIVDQQPTTPNSNRIILLILKELKLTDVFQLKKVCKAWKKVIDEEYKPKKLIVFIKQFSYNDTWSFSDGEPLDAKCALRIPKLEKFFKSEFIRSFFKNIESLAILNFPFDNEMLDLEHLNQFTNLVHLEIRSLKLKDQCKLSLPNLKTLCVCKQSYSKVIIDCPKLTKFRAMFNLNHFKIEHPLSLQYLECAYFSAPIKTFLNLEYLYVEFISHVGRTFLEKMTKLKEIQFFDFGTTNVVDSLRKQKKKLDRKELAICFLGINFDHTPKMELMKFERFHLYDANIQLYVANQSRLARCVAFIRKVTYNSLTSRSNVAILQDFHLKFPNIGFVQVESKVESREQFLKFLGNCKQLRILHIKSSHLEASDFSRLPDVAPSIIYLTILDESEIDCSFVLKFRNLIKFQIDQSVPSTVLQQSFMLEYFKTFSFKFQSNTIFIKKSTYYLLIVSNNYTDCFKNLDDLIKVLKKNYGTK